MEMHEPKKNNVTAGNPAATMWVSGSEGHFHWCKCGNSMNMVEGKEKPKVKMTEKAKEERNNPRQANRSSHNSGKEIQPMDDGSRVKYCVIQHDTCV